MNRGVNKRGGGGVAEYVCKLACVWNKNNVIFVGFSSEKKKI